MKRKKNSTAKKRRKPKYRSFLSSSTWKELRVKILNRDGCKCAVCGSSDGLAVHHLLLRRTWPELQTDEDNLVPLCRSCHARFKRKFTAHGDPVAFWLLFEKLRPAQAKRLKAKMFATREGSEAGDIA